MAYQYAKQFVAMGSGSTSTSPAWYVGDFRLLSVSIESSASLGPTNVIIQGSNSDGLQSAADLGGSTSNTGWSNITIVLPGTLNAGGNVGRGIFTFDPPGYRWVRSFVSPTLQSVASNMTIIFEGSSF
jgi:hypothetical protein